MKGVKGFVVGHQHSEETKRKIGDALRKQVAFNCDNCDTISYVKPSSFARRKRHFCSKECYSEYRKTKLPKEEQSRYGTGFSEKERKRRKLCRGKTNKAVLSGKIKRKNCEVCGYEKTEAHHDDYSKPLDVRWLCFPHHREWHKKNPELLEAKQ